MTDYSNDTIDYNNNSFTRGQLTETFFKDIAPAMKDWKDPIQYMCTQKKVNLYSAAIQFMTGGRVNVSPNKESKEPETAMLLTAKGYWIESGQ